MQTGASPDAIGYDPSSNQVLTANSRSNTISVLGGTSPGDATLSTLVQPAYLVGMLVLVLAIVTFSVVVVRRKKAGRAGAN